MKKIFTLKSIGILSFVLLLLAIIFTPTMQVENKNPEIFVYGSMSLYSVKGDYPLYALKTGSDTYLIKIKSRGFRSETNMCHRIKMISKWNGISDNFLDRYNLIEQTPYGCKRN